MSESRHCKGYLVNCKNPAVKGRLFCFTCAGRKSRNKKTLALETCERDVKELRAKLEDMTAELEHWKNLATHLRESEEAAKQELKALRKTNPSSTVTPSVKKIKDLLSEPPSSISNTPSCQNLKMIEMEIDISSAATALLSIGTPVGKFISHPASNPIAWRVPDAKKSHIAPAAEIFSL